MPRGKCPAALGADERDGRAGSWSKWLARLIWFVTCLPPTLRATVATLSSEVVTTLGAHFDAHLAQGAKDLGSREDPTRCYEAEFDHQNWRE